VENPGAVQGRVAQGMCDTIEGAAVDKRIPRQTLADMTALWEENFLGLACA
jgi:hypothetical protein